MHKIRNDQILKTSKAELPTEISAVGGKKNTQKSPKGKNAATRLYKLIEIGRKKLRKAKKGCSEA